MRKIRTLFSRNLLVLALVFVVGAVVENQLRVLSLVGGSMGGLVQVFAMQVSVFWALAIAAAGVALVVLASRVSWGTPRGQRAAASRNSRLAGRVGRQQRSG